MKYVRVIALVCVSFVIVTSQAFSEEVAESVKIVENENKDDSGVDAYSGISWDSVNKDREVPNFNEQLYGYAVRSRSIESITGDDITVVETAIQGKAADEDYAPLGIIAVNVDEIK